MPRDPHGDVPPDRRSRSGRFSVVAVTAAILVVSALLLTGCDADPAEEVDVGYVVGGQAALQREDGTVRLTGRIDEVLTESALTVTDERSEDLLLVLVAPATIVNSTIMTTGGLAQFVAPDGTLKVVGTIDTFDSVALAERLGIVLNDGLFAPWDGDPVLIASRVETFGLDAGLAAKTGLESE